MAYKRPEKMDFETHWALGRELQGMLIALVGIEELVNNTTLVTDPASKAGVAALGSVELFREKMDALFKSEHSFNYSPFVYHSSGLSEEQRVARHEQFLLKGDRV